MKQILLKIDAFDVACHKCRFKLTDGRWKCRLFPKEWVPRPLKTYKDGQPKRCSSCLAAQRLVGVSVASKRKRRKLKARPRSYRRAYYGVHCETPGTKDART